MAAVANTELPKFVRPTDLSSTLLSGSANAKLNGLAVASCSVVINVN